MTQATSLLGSFILRKCGSNNLRHSSNDILDYERRMRVELDAWLDGRKEWSHDDWLDLMLQLRSKNLGEFTASQEGREFIGNYLEIHRRRLAEQAV